MKKSTNKKDLLKDKKTVLFGVALVLAAPLAVYTLPGLTKTDYTATSPTSFSNEAGESDKTEPVVRDGEVVAHVATPEAVRAIYMTSCVAGTPSFREDLVALVEETELNSIIIDIKDYSGTISFPPQATILQPAWEGARCGTRAMKDFITELHDKGIYVMGRITVFQDPFYSDARPDLAVKRESDGGVWEDYKGLSFIDVGAQEYWDYIVELSKESYNIGFDELNFDYVRFPSDGNMKDIAFTHTKVSKAEQLERFFMYLNEKLTDPTFAAEEVEHVVKESTDTPRPILSADLFGMTTTNTDDLNIGQVLERALPYFDYIAPMVYPSHYPKGFNGWANPNDHPYDLIHYVMKSGVERAVATTTPVEILTGEPLYNETQVFDSQQQATTTSKVFSGLYKKEKYNPNVLRPWIQDFDYGGDYDVAEVRAQIQATYDVGLNSWMLWAPSNRYTRGALEEAQAE